MEERFLSCYSAKPSPQPLPVGEGDKNASVIRLHAEGEALDSGICDSLALVSVVLLNDLGAAALESQNRKPDPGFGLR